MDQPLSSLFPLPMDSLLSVRMVVRPCLEIRMATPFLTFLQLAAWVLHRSSKPLTAAEMWEAAERDQLVKHLRSFGKTPVQTLIAQVYVHVRDEANPWIRQVSHRPARFEVAPESIPLEDILQCVAASEQRLAQNGAPQQPAPIAEDDEAAETDHQPRRAKKFSYIERETHPFLVRFAHHRLGSYAKTIYHEVSKRGSYGQWLHPDLVGFRFPFQKCNADLVRLVGGPDQVMTLFSFEVKRELHLGNLRESFFQAVSNSSWANEGYLAASIIDDRAAFMDELRRLSNSFGIGVIELDLEDPEASEIVLPAKTRLEIDFEAANKLAKENSDFASFLRNVQIDVSCGHPHPSEYDPILKVDELRMVRGEWEARARRLG